MAGPALANSKEGDDGLDRYEIREKTGASEYWQKVSTTDGREGFVNLGDLLTPAQRDARNELVEKGRLLDSYLERMKSATGPFAAASGVFPIGGPCIDPIKSGSASLNMGLALLSRWVQWGEGNTYYQVNLTNPAKVFESHLAPRGQLTVNDSSIRLRLGEPIFEFQNGPVQMYQLIGSDGKAGDTYGARKGKLYFNRAGQVRMIISQCPGGSSYAKELWDTWTDQYPRLHFPIAKK